jgi:hypothetical protein
VSFGWSFDAEQNANDCAEAAADYFGKEAGVVVRWCDDEDGKGWEVHAENLPLEVVHVHEGRSSHQPNQRFSTFCVAFAYSRKDGI